MDKCIRSSDAQFERHSSIEWYVLRCTPEVSVRLGFVTVSFGRGTAGNCQRGRCTWTILEHGGDQEMRIRGGVFRGTVAGTERCETEGDE